MMQDLQRIYNFYSNIVVNVKQYCSTMSNLYLCMANTLHKVIIFHIYRFNININNRMPTKIIKVTLKQSNLWQNSDLFEKYFLRFRIRSHCTYFTCENDVLIKQYQPPSANIRHSCFRWKVCYMSYVFYSRNTTMFVFPTEWAKSTYAPTTDD
jgi:uncharacterized ubiquitin-like protein YukD